jgi:hypothetical protein
MLATVGAERHSLRVSSGARVRCGKGHEARAEDHPARRGRSAPGHDSGVSGCKVGRGESEEKVCVVEKNMRGWIWWIANQAAAWQ